MGDDRKAEYEMAPTEDPENPSSPPEKSDLQDSDGQGDQEWSGLGKEELLRVADTPAWNWTRNILLILFWIAWIVMLIVAIVLVVKAPSCPSLEWYEKSSVYQVFVPSFKDGDGDGIGDLKGLRGQIEKILASGAESIVLSSIFQQDRDDGPFNSNGRSTVDFKKVDPLFGTLEDFKGIIAEAQINSMHVVIEFVPNQSSDKHMWFEESKKGGDGNEYADFYVWANGEGENPPNDWKNYKGEPAWTEVKERDQWYYHFYESNQPDLNFKNEKVVQAIQDVMMFWLDEMNVDGFVLVDADRLLEDVISSSVNVSRKRRQADASPSPASDVTEMMTTTLEPMPDLTAEPMPEQSPEPGTGGTDMTEDTAAEGGVEAGDYAQYNVLGGSTLSDDLQTLLESLYSILKDNSYLGKYRVFIPQHSGPLEDNVYYQRKEWLGYATSLAFAKSLGSDISGHVIRDQLIALEEAKERDGKEGLWDGFMVGYAGLSRFATRTGDNARALMMLLFTLPGTPLPFYGDELGLTDNAAGGTTSQLTPYPWDGSATGGFSYNDSVEPWAPYADNLEDINAEAQSEDDKSFLSYYKQLTMYKSEPSLQAGNLTIEGMSGEVLAYRRSFPEWPEYLFVINLSEEAKSGLNAYGTDRTGKVVLSASGAMMEEGDNLVMPGSLDIGGNDAYLIELMD